MSDIDQPFVRIDPPGPDRFGSMDTSWCIWLEPDDEARHTGLCIGVGKTKEEAQTDAVNALRRAMDQILKP